MKLLITGAGGQLGQEWVHFCKGNEIEYSAYSSKNLNILDEDNLANIFEQDNPDILINCAAYTKVDQAEDEPQLAGLVNSESLKFICELCSVHQTKLVHYSTDYVFSGSEEDRKEVPDGYPEDFKTNPINIYGSSKRRGELAIIESGCKYMIIRVSWLCGQFGNNFVKTMLRLGEERERLTVVNDQFGSPTFTDQVVEQTYQLIHKNKSGIFHLSSKGTVTWCEFAKEIFNQKNLGVEVVPVSSSEFKTKAMRPYFSKLSTQKISTIEGIKILSWQEGLKKLLNSL
ncbi:MAG: dTDP-4-dehydrorhamnose reductase [Balneolaceae bacterium]|nr:dTDP-4-dehydrorhamnose reductase [Balneolaceae bacterium]MBO6547227.1 dTDP-4-dehydrorhamnose reductase [Balneolaceae bacterium]MBO6647826.1 dTDP-4-dehydrorhamnose reductase [Balneolaceae bacterium]